MVAVAAVAVTAGCHSSSYAVVTVGGSGYSSGGDVPPANNDARDVKLSTSPNLNNYRIREGHLGVYPRPNYTFFGWGCGF